MKLLALMLVCLICPLTTASAHILANENFDGTAHWEGDGKSAGDGGGITITLKPELWTKIEQRINTRDTAMILALTYSISPDSSLLSPQPAFRQFVASADFFELTGLRVLTKPLPLPTSAWIAIIVDKAKNLIDTSMVLSEITTDSQTKEGKFIDLSQFEDETLVICFPPGSGTVTLTRAELHPAPVPTSTAN